MQWTLLPISAFADCKAEWDSLNRGHANLPILDSSFFAALIKHFPVDSDAVVAIGRDGDRALCAGILEPGKLGASQTYQPAQAPLGAWVQAAGFDPEAALPSYFSGRGLLSLTLGISQLDPEHYPRPPTSGYIKTLDYIETAMMDIAGSFEAYWAARGKNLRQNQRKQRARLDKDGIVPQLLVHTEPTAVALAVDEYGRVESRGWKGKDGTALSPDNAQGRFYREMLADFAARGEAVIYQYAYDAKVVASDLCLARNGVLIILKTTYDEEHNNTSPAMLMRYEALRPIFDERKFRRIEFYGRMMEWHGRLTESKKTLYHLNCFRVQALGALDEARRG